jgi:prepilin-type N-terminal cleavage/methylation domain-containing protein
LKRRALAGFTLLEVVVSMTIFGVFLMIAFMLTSEMRGWEKRLPVNFMRHPQVISVIARMKRDVQDVHPPAGTQIYVDEWEGYKNGPKTLIVQTQLKTGTQTIVWDLSERGIAKRIAWNVGIDSEWTARGLPEEFSSGVGIEAVKFPGRPYGVRLIAKDKNGKTAIDQILQPRTYK